MVSLAAHGNGKDTVAQKTASHCPIKGCPAYLVPVTNKFGEELVVAYRLDHVPAKRPPVASLMFGVPHASDLDTYRDFTHLYAPAPTDYLTPNKSWILLRYRGEIRYAKRVLWTMYNERRRRTDDLVYRQSTGSAFMPPGHVIRVDKPVTIIRAFRWIDPRHRKGLHEGSIFDPQGGEPFHWQMALVVKTTDGRRLSARPFTVTRTSDLLVPTASSKAERALADSLARAGIDTCPHVQSIHLPGGVARPDIIVPSQRIVIEYDGSYWHHGSANHARDIKKTRKFLDDDWHVIRVREAGLDRLSLQSKRLHQVVMVPHETEDQLTQRVLDLIH